MAEKLLMLALSPTMEAGAIVKWNKKEGDIIRMNEPICEVETDKASMDYESMNEGILLKIIVSAGNSAIVGQTIGVVGEKGEDITAILNDLREDGKLPDKPQSSGFEMTKTLQKHTSKDAAPSTPAAVASPPVPPVSSAGSLGTERIKASPLAKKIAGEKGIVLAHVQGTGPGGRILKKDVEQAQPHSNQAHVRKHAHATTQYAQSETDSVTPVKGVRAVIAQRLSASKFSAPHFYVKNLVRTEQMMALRSKINETAREKVSLNAVIIKFVAEAIKACPEINSGWQEDGAESTIIKFGSIDIGLAVDLGNGLLTPVVRNCERKGIMDIDSDLKELIEKVRNSTISVEEYTNASFTISNLGSFGVDEFTAIINPPGAAILAIGKGNKVPVVNAQGAIEVGTVMAITLSSDHRVIDGSLAGRFIARLQSIIENPAVALL